METGGESALSPRLRAANPLTLQATAVVLAGGVLLATLLFVIDSDRMFRAGSFAVYIAVAAIVITRIAAFHPHARFGFANTVTLVRFVLTSVLAGVAFSAATARLALSPERAWMFFSLAAAALVLDGIDGFAARRQGIASAFGARFDMEIDALQILCLSVVAYVSGKAGAWVLLSGLMRYLFVVAGVVWPRLAAPLPQLWRRKTIAVIQGVVLAALLAPIVQPPTSAAIAAAALILLVYSFAADVLWLVTRR